MKEEQKIKTKENKTKKNGECKTKFLNTRFSLTSVCV